MRKGEENHGTILLDQGKMALLGGVIALLVCLAFLLLASLGISVGLLGMELRYQLAVAGCVIGSFIGGMTAARRCSSGRLLIGIAAGVVLFLLLLTIGLLLYDDFSMENGGLGLMLGALCGGAAAGLLSGGGKRNARKTKKRGKR